MISLLASIVYFLLLLYFFTMWARFLLDLAANFARDWRPKGFLLVVAELVFTLTDPPLRAVKRVIPPVRFGGIALDFAWSIVMLVVVVLIYVVAVIRVMAA